MRQLTAAVLAAALLLPIPALAHYAKSVATGEPLLLVQDPKGKNQEVKGKKGKDSAKKAKGDKKKSDKKKSDEKLKAAPTKSQSY